MMVKAGSFISFFMQFILAREHTNGKRHTVHLISYDSGHIFFFFKLRKHFILNLKKKHR